MFDQLRSLADVLKLIERGERESEILEYKTASVLFKPSDRDEVAKDISALANSLGGTIIYGVATDSSDKTLPVRIEPILPQNIDQIVSAAGLGIRHPVAGL